MKKLRLTIFLITLLLCSAVALAEDYIIPDPEHFFGQSMEEIREYNYVMYFDEDPRDMYDAYMALLLSNYNMYDLEIVPTAHILSKVGVENQGMTIQYDVDDEGYHITFSIPSLLQLEKREQYDPKWADAQEPSGIVLPDPGHYFDKFYAAGSISFDEYPKAEFDAYTALLTGKYGLEITEEYHGENKEYCHMAVPGVDNARVYVSCFYDSNRQYWTGSGNAMDIQFSGSITLSALDVYENPAGGAIVEDDGTALMSPAGFFDGKYTFFNAVDNTGIGSTWVTYSFRVTGDATKEEVAADTENYRQALVDSGYFEHTGTSGYDLAYTGDREVAVATAKGKSRGWQVNVNMTGGYSDVPYIIRVNLVDGFRFTDMSILSAGEEEHALPSNPGDIAWDGGRMIADPGDFLGYEIAVTDILDMTSYNHGGNYFGRDYEEIAMSDIEKYIDALENSPYFEISGTHEAKSAGYKQIFFEYVGSDAELSASCVAGRRNSKRECDLYIQIHYRARDRSTFRIVTFPEFTVNSAANVEPQPEPEPGDKQRCMYCDKGSCKKCGGKGFVYQYSAYEKDLREKKDCSSCIAGRCTFCDGTGWR